jgi:peptide deformylase
VITNASLSNPSTSNLEPIYGWGAVPLAAIPPILLSGDKRLREVSDPVAEKVFEPDPSTTEPPQHVPNNTFREGLRFMAAALDLYGGAAIAAPQLGILQRVIVIAGDISGGLIEYPFALINPIIREQSSETLTEVEGCLSFPKVGVRVERPTWVQLEARAPSGSEIKIKASGLFARVICHEIEHLDGKLLVDHAGRLKRQMIETKMAKLRRRLQHAKQRRA